jgi:hypothetical protein
MKCHCGEPTFHYQLYSKEGEERVTSDVHKCKRLKYNTDTPRRVLSKKQPCDFKFSEVKNRRELDKIPVKKEVIGKKHTLDYLSELNRSITNLEVNIENKFIAGSNIGHINYYLNILGYNPFIIDFEGIEELKKRISGPQDKKKVTIKKFQPICFITDPDIIKLLKKTKINKKTPPKITKPQKKKKAEITYIDCRETDYKENEDEDFEEKDPETIVYNPNVDCEENEENDEENDEENEKDQENESEVEDPCAEDYNTEDDYVSDGGDFSD